MPHKEALGLADTRARTTHTPEVYSHSLVALICTVANFGYVRLEKCKSRMRTALIFAVLFAGCLLDRAYLAPLADADAVLQEIRSVLEQAKTSKPTPKPHANKPPQHANKPGQHANTSGPKRNTSLSSETRADMPDPHTKINFLCEVVGKVAVDIRTNGHLKSQFLTREGVEAALNVAQAIHSAWRLQHPRIDVQEQEQTEAISLACLATSMQVKSHSSGSNKNTTVSISSPNTEQRS